MKPDFNTLAIDVNPDFITLDVGVKPDFITLDVGVKPDFKQNEKYLDFMSQKQCMAPMFLTRTIYFSPISYLLFYPLEITSLCTK